MSSTELKPCPACESNRVEIYAPSPFFVKCRDCCLSGPDFLTEDEVLAGWNAMPRAPVPRPYSEWTETDGAVLWWLYPLDFAPKVRSPNDWDWRYDSSDEPNLYWTPIDWNANLTAIKALRGEA